MISDRFALEPEIAAFLRMISDFVSNLFIHHEAHETTRVLSEMRDCYEDIQACEPRTAWISHASLFLQVG
jgi:hypothetical protein